MVSTLDSVEVIDPACFCVKSQDGCVISMTLARKTPFKLHIELNYLKNEVILEFTGKVLGPDYPKLISQNTIQMCFQRINDLGFCRINPDKMMDAEVLLCDVTKDIPLADIPSFNRFIRSHVRNYLAFNCRICQKTGNLILEKNVTGKDYKRRLTIYDKQKEMKRSAGKKYMIENGIEGNFNGLCRFEMNLQSKQAIRDALAITGTTLREVLQSSTNPIEKLLADAIQEDSSPSSQDTWKTYWQTLVLKDCDYDLEKVEAKLREYKDSGINRAMTPFRSIMETQPAGSTKWTKAKILEVVK